MPFSFPVTLIRLLQSNIKESLCQLLACIRVKTPGVEADLASDHNSGETKRYQGLPPPPTVPPPLPLPSVPEHMCTRNMVRLRQCL